MTERALRGMARPRQMQIDFSKSHDYTYLDMPITAGGKRHHADKVWFLPLDGEQHWETNLQL